MNIDQPEQPLESLELLLKEVLIEILGLEVVPEDIGSSEPLFDGVGMDSVATIEFVISVEERLGVVTAEEDLSTELLSSIRSYATYLLARMEA